MSLQITPSDPREICLALNERTPVGGLFEGDRDHLHPNSNLPWRISPEPFWLSPEQHEQLQALGGVLHQFYKAANLLYHQSVKGIQPAWVHQYLDQGKPGDVLEMGLWNRVKSHLPLVMRPDLFSPTTASASLRWTRSPAVWVLRRRFRRSTPISATT